MGRSPQGDWTCAGIGGAAGGVDSEVVAEVAKRSRRRFTNVEKRRILAAADRCTQPGEPGALRRKEGIERAFAVRSPSMP